MQDHSECKRQFIQLSKAWYADANLRNSKFDDKISIGFYHPEGGTTGEFEIEFSELCGRIVPKLTAYDDGWSALFNFSDLIEKMAEIDDKCVSADEFCELLVLLGIENKTPTEQE